ncbi:MAG: 3-keto-5-aminohexanoate cleavage protein [Acidobacteriota bacterium]
MPYKLNDVSWRFTDNREWFEHFRNWPPVIISCAITGGVHTKEANPNLPQSPEEQADAAYEAYKSGASIVHIHARSPASGYYDSQSATAEDFYRVNKLIRDRCPEIIINDTGSNMFGPEFDEEKMTDFLKICHPEVCSLDVGMIYMRAKVKTTPEMIEQMERDKELGVFGRAGDVVTEVLPGNLMYYEGVVALGYTKTEQLARAMRATDVKPELEVFNSQSWWFVDNLINQGVVEPPCWCQLVFGQDGTSSPPSVKTAMEMIDNMPTGALFSAIGVGALQLPITTLSLIMGGHIRVGLEDNVYYRKGELAENNAQQVKRAVRIIHELNREVATPAQAREMLGLNWSPRLYP